MPDTDKKLVKCTGCNVEYKVLRLKYETRFKCRKCGTINIVPKDTPSPVVTPTPNASEKTFTTSPAAEPKPSAPQQNAPVTPVAVIESKPIVPPSIPAPAPTVSVVPPPSMPTETRPPEPKAKKEPPIYIPDKRAKKEPTISLVDLLKNRLGKNNEETLEFMEQLKTDIINELLKGNKVAWHNMFSLNLTQKAARLRQIPLTSKAVFIPPQQSIQFKPGKGLKQQINLGVKEKNVFIISPDPDKFHELTKELTGNKITVSIFASVNELKERITTLKNISVTVIDFPPHSPEYDEITFSLKRNTTLSLIGLIGLIPPDYDPLKISDLKIMCDRWIKNSMSLSELKEAILSDVSRTDEERVFFNNRLNLRLPSDNQHTEKLDILMEELVGRTKFKSEKKYEFISAIKEAIMNGARHGNKYNQNKFVDVEYLIDKQKITFTITDEGPGFDFETHLRKTEKDSQEILKETRDKPSENGAGFGIVLMKKCVDELIYLPPGNIVSLVKYFKPDKIS